MDDNINLTQTLHCPDCGAVLSADSPQGLCPKCLLAMGESSLGMDDLRSEELGERVGRYKLLQKIGEGGCGVVYMAEQEEPVRRRVALKVIKLGMDTANVIARFEAERQALAMMDHPNIAKVFDAGATASGRPYFVMELVRGTKITNYCDENSVPIADRLKLFNQVCQAIQHAHQKGIIHRDIKPSNVLVTLHGDVAVPKVIDFGLAKAMNDQKLTDKTLFTAFEQFVGTPAYMSPEHAAMSGLDIDTRSDIYSLGVLLYELLTGKPPFDPKELVRAGLDEIRRIIREVEPARPSTKLSTMVAGDLATVAQRRRSDSPKLIHLLKGDLDWIVMKALEKDRTRRYETANSLGLDVQRHLNAEPVIARPPTTFYRFQKLVRRNKLVFGAAGSVAVAIFLGLGASSCLYLKERKARERAVAAEHNQRQLRAEAQEAQANEAQLRKEAEATGKRLGEALKRVELQWSEDLFASGDSSGGLAYLARILRHDSSNAVAAERLASALTHRNFPLPAIEPIEHKSPVRCVQFSPDGLRFVTASWKSAHIWDATTGALKTGPLEHDPHATVVAAQFSEDGQRLLTACAGQERQPGFARIWDVTSGNPLTEPLMHTAGVTSAQFSPDGRCAVTASMDGTARIWDSTTGQPLTQPLRHGDAVFSAQFSSDGLYVVTASRDNSARVWEAKSGRQISRTVGDAPIVSAQFSASGGLFITTSAKISIIDPNTQVWNAAQNAQIWNSSSGLPTTQPLQHSGGVLSAEFSPDGGRVVTASEDRSALVWDVKTGQPITEPLRHSSRVNSAQFSSDGERVLTASWDKTARVWDAKTGRALTEPIFQQDGVIAARFSPDSRRVVTAGEMTARLWEIRAPKKLAIQLKHDGTITSAQFSPDCKRVVTASYDRTAVIWDAQTGESLVVIPDSIRIHYAQFSPDGKHVVTCNSHSARIWDASTGAPITEPLPLNHTNDFKFADFSPDGGRVVTASLFTARVWDAQTGQPITEPLQHQGRLRSARFSPNGNQVLTASADRTARLWDAKTGALIATLQHDEAVLSARFRPDGNRVLTTCKDKTVRVWDLNTGKPLLSPLRHEDDVISAAFSPDGLLIVTASYDRNARVWDASTGQPVTVPLQHTEGLRVAEFSPDGRRVLTGSGKTARLWDTKTGLALSELFVHEKEVSWAEFSPDGEHIITVSSRTAQIFATPKISLPVPAWVPKLAEAIAARRINDQNIPEPVPFNEFREIREDIVHSNASDFWTRWGKWYFADSDTPWR